MFETLVKEVLGDLSDDVSRKLIRELEEIGKDYLTNLVTANAGRILVKGIDEVVEAAVRVLDEAQDVSNLVEEYAVKLDDEWVELLDAVKKYIPLQVAVEVAKKKHGNKSAEANAAREKRKAGITEVKEEVRDVFASIIGDTVAD